MNRIGTAPLLRHLEPGGPLARTGGPRRMAYWVWPAADAACRRVLICVHGLTRQGRDFDLLAQAMQSDSHVLAVDVAGRGESDWLDDPLAYQIPTYAADLLALVQHVRSELPDASLDWVGSSLGGLIGMALAAQPGLGLRRLVLNDVGPVIELAALQRMVLYVGRNPSFASAQEAIDYLRSISGAFGPHTPAQWLALSGPMLRERAGRWWLHYDPAIALPFQALAEAAAPLVQQAQAALWSQYDAIAARTLLLRGADSDLLSRATAAQMAARGPRAHCVEFAGVGHAPTLVAADQLAVVKAFLNAA